MNRPYAPAENTHAEGKTGSSWVGQFDVQTSAAVSGKIEAKPDVYHALNSLPDSLRDIL